VSFARLQRADVAALLAAFALIAVTAMDWYSTVHAEEGRRLQENADPQGRALGGEIPRAVDEAGRIAGESGERNAWQPFEAIDWVILVTLLGAYAMALLSAFLRAAGRRPEPPFTPAALGSALAGFGALLVAYRIWQEPGVDSFSTVTGWAPVAILVLGFLSLALATAYRGEDSGRAWEVMERADARAAEPPASEPPPTPTT
jgi:hypothetical protein